MDRSKSPWWLIAIRLVAALAALPCLWRGVRGAYLYLSNGAFLLLARPAMYLMLSVVLLWFALKGSQAVERKRALVALAVGLGLGFLGFVGGFFGPILLTPDSNQGPLLGILFTGPLGVVLGCLLGGALVREKPAAP